MIWIQSSSQISYLMYSDLHHHCKPYEQTIECFTVSLNNRHMNYNRKGFDFLKSFSIYIKYKSEMKYDWKNSISCAIIVFVTKKWEI